MSREGEEQRSTSPLADAHACVCAHARTRTHTHAHARTHTASSPRAHPRAHSRRDGGECCRRHGRRERTTVAGWRATPGAPPRQRQHTLVLFPKAHTQTAHRTHTHTQGDLMAARNTMALNRVKREIAEVKKDTQVRGGCVCACGCVCVIVVARTSPIAHAHCRARADQGRQHRAVGAGRGRPHAPARKGGGAP